MHHQLSTLNRNLNLNRSEDLRRIRIKIRIKIKSGSNVLHKTTRALAILLSLGFGPLASAQTNSAAATFSHTGGKELVIPTRNITRVPEGNDFNNPDSEYCFKHSKST